MLSFVVQVFPSPFATPLQPLVRSGYRGIVILVAVLSLNAVGPVEVFAQQTGKPAPYAPPAQTQHVTTQPQPLNLLEFRREVGYPPKAKKAGIQGTVEITVLVDRTGKVVSHRVTSTKVDPMLINAVVEKLSFLRYKPATKDGKPIPQHTKVTVKFDI